MSDEQMAREGEPIFTMDDLPVATKHQQAPDGTRDRFRDWIREKTWVFAKSSPHEYLHKDEMNFTGRDRELFEQLVVVADEYGYNLRWHNGVVYRNFDIGDHKYWSYVSNDPDMVGELTIQERAAETFILNRSKIDGYTDREIETGRENRSYGALFK